MVILLSLHLRLYLRLHLSCTCMSLAGALKSSQIDRSNGGPDTALAGTLHGGINVALEGTS